MSSEKNKQYKTPPIQEKKIMSEKTFYSNGKLLITSEYLVLDGAKAFALPTKFGQNLVVKEGNNDSISWKSYDFDNSIWFEDNINFSEIKNPKTTDKDTIRNTLIKILHQAYKANPKFLTDSKGYEITTQLTFPKQWGLGTSSTLINNIAQWLEIDAFKLLKNSFGGSGYDIACAQNNTPIYYQIKGNKPKIEKIHFNPAFTDNIYFVYLNKKQSSKNEIKNYAKYKPANIDKIITKVDKITHEILHAKNDKSFAKALKNHEAELSSVLKTEPVKERLFFDFNGEIKSLGAWGGDFIMVHSEVNPITYFTSKGYSTVIPYKEMIL